MWITFNQGKLLNVTDFALPNLWDHSGKFTSRACLQHSSNCVSISLKWRISNVKPCGCIPYLATIVNCHWTEVGTSVVTQHHCSDGRLHYLEVLVVSAFYEFVFSRITRKNGRDRLVVREEIFYWVQAATSGIISNRWREETGKVEEPLLLLDKGWQMNFPHT